MFKIYFLEEGTHTDSNGSVDNYSRKDLEEIKNSYDPEIFESPIVIGHDDDISTLYTQRDSIPAYGWVKKLGVDNKGLYAEAELSPELESLVLRKVPAYKHISGAIYGLESPNNPNVGKSRYLRHIAFLGGSPPAIKGLPKAVKLYKEHSVLNNSLLKYDGNLENMNYKTYNEDEEILLPSVNAPIEEVQGFLDNNSEEFLKYVLTDGEYGYPGEITRFEPEVNKENNYLLNTETGKFEGFFYDDYSSEIDGYEFEVGKRGGMWYSSYAPVNKEEIEEFTEEESIEPLLNQSDESFMASQEELSDEGEQSLAMGELPEISPKEEPIGDSSISSELELIRYESKNLRNEVLRLKSEINDMKINEFKNYVESKSGLLSNLGVNKKDLLKVFGALDQKASAKVYKEGVKSPLDIFKDILQKVEKTNSKSVSYGEFCSDEEEFDEYEEGQELGYEPYGVVSDEDSMKLHKEIVKLCKVKGLDPNDPKAYSEVYKSMNKVNRV